MGTFRVTLDIDRPTPDVFAYVAEPRNMPLWYEAVERVVEIPSDSTASAASYQIIRSLPGGHVDNIVEVTASAPDHTVTLESREGPTPFRYRYDIEPRGAGSVVTLDGQISSAGLPGPLNHLDGIATRAFKKGMQQNLQNLKRLIESGSDALPDHR